MAVHKLKPVCYGYIPFNSLTGVSSRCFVYELSGEFVSYQKLPI